MGTLGRKQEQEGGKHSGMCLAATKMHGTEKCFRELFNSGLNKQQGIATKQCMCR